MGGAVIETYSRERERDRCYGLVITPKNKKFKRTLIIYYDTVVVSGDVQWGF